MIVRLAFSVAISVDPEILLVDEALAVGDIRFQQRCMTRIRQLRDQGVSILLVTHDLEAAKRLCEQIHVLEQGHLIHSGPPAAVANWYLGYMTESPLAVGQGSEPVSAIIGPAARDDRQQTTTAFQFFRHGDGNARITRVELLTLDGQPVQAAETGETYCFRFTVEFYAVVETPILGFYLRDRLGTDVIGVNTYQEKTPLPAAQPGDSLTVAFTMPLRLRPGHYAISPGLAYKQDEMRFMDWIDNALVFEVVDLQPGRTIFGLMYPEVAVEVHRGRSGSKVDV
jgi:lipopolysaccharide transport system ATP-binding protein